MSFADTEQDTLPPDDTSPTTFHTQAHVGHQGHTHIQAYSPGQFQQDTYTQPPFLEQARSLAESQFYFVEYRSRYATTGQDQVDNAAQARMASLSQICRPDQATRPISGSTVYQHCGYLPQVPQMYDETPRDQGFLPSTSAAAHHNIHNMMRPGNNPQRPSYQSAEFKQPNTGLQQPRDAGNLDGATSPQGHEFTQPNSSDLEGSSSGSASEHGHSHKSNTSNARSQPFTAPSQAKRRRNKGHRQQTPEPPDSEGSGSKFDSSGDGDWRESAPNKKRQRLDSTASTTKASTIKTKKRDVKRTSNVVRHAFQQSKPHTSLQDKDGNAVFPAVFGVYELAGEQGYCERNQAPEIYRRNNMRALQCHYTLRTTSSATDGLLFVREPTTGKKHLLTSMTFRISGVTSENEQEDLPILESDNKRSKWTPTEPKPKVLPHIPPFSDDAVADGATRFRKSVGVGDDNPKSTHYEWSHLQFQAGTKHNGVRRTTQMFQFMRLSLIAEWGEGEHDRTKVASCSGQRYIVFARSPGGRKALTKDNKEGSEVTKRKGKSRGRQDSTPSPGPEQELGRVQRKHNQQGLKAGKRKRQRRHESTPPPTPKAEPESDSEPLTGRIRRKAAQAGPTPRDILGLPSSTQEQELRAANRLKEENQRSRKVEDPRANTPAAHVSPDRVEEELMSPLGSTDFADSSPFGSPDLPPSTEPGWRSQLESHIAVAIESEAPTLTEGATAPYGTTVVTPSFFDEDPIWEESEEEAEDSPEVKEDPDEKYNVGQESPKAPGQMRAAESDLLAGVGGNLGENSQVLRRPSMLPTLTPNMAGVRPSHSTQFPSAAGMVVSYGLADSSARQHGPLSWQDIFKEASDPDTSRYGINPSALHYNNQGPLTAIGRSGSTAFDWQQLTPMATINPGVFRNEFAGLGHDPYIGVDEEEMRSDMVKEFWDDQL